MTEKFSLVIITVPDLETARSMAKILLTNRLVACVNIINSIESHYWWNEKINMDSELLLICKTKCSLVNDNFMNVVKANHSYQVPEILSIPIDSGFHPYLEWILMETSPI